MTMVGATPFSLYPVVDALSEFESERLHAFRDQSQAFETNPADGSDEASKKSEFLQKVTAYIRARERRRKKPKATLMSSPQIKYDGATLPDSPFDKPGALLDTYA